MLNLGIDDAGRGPVIGPMVLAGCLLDGKAEAGLKKSGVRDSKELTQKRREHLDGIIKKEAEKFEIIVIQPKVIDELEKRQGVRLNELEAEACADIINKINTGSGKIKIVVDCPSPNKEKWKDYLKTKTENLSNLEISCEHKADKNHVSVSAASVLAKNVREKEMSVLREKYGDGIGSGYCSDPLTLRFMEKNMQKYADDGIFRKTWSTWKNLVQKKQQRKLSV